MKIQVHHWLHNDPPLPSATKEDDIWVLNITTLEDLELVLSQNDLLFCRKDDGELLLLVDEKQGRFNQR